MACPWQIFYLFFLIIRYAWSIMAPDYFSHFTAFNNHHKKNFSMYVTGKQDHSMISQEYSWERLQTNKYGLLKCAQQLHQCREIGIIGAGKVSFFDRLYI
jgi:hypothetical protein